MKITSKSIVIGAITTASLSLFSIFIVILSVSTNTQDTQHYKDQQYVLRHYPLDTSTSYQPCDKIISAIKSDPTGKHSFLESAKVGWRELFAIGKTCKFEP